MVQEWNPTPLELCARWPLPLNYPSPLGFLSPLPIAEVAALRCKQIESHTVPVAIQLVFPRSDSCHHSTGAFTSCQACRSHSGVHLTQNTYNTFISRTLPAAARSHTHRHHDLLQLKSGVTRHIRRRRWLQKKVLRPHRPCVDTYDAYIRQIERVRFCRRQSRTCERDPQPARMRKQTRKATRRA